MMKKKQQEALLGALDEARPTKCVVQRVGPDSPIKVKGVRGVVVRPLPLGSALWSVLVTDGGVNENGESDGKRRVYVLGLATGEALIMDEDLAGNGWIPRAVDAVLNAIDDARALTAGEDLPERGECQ